VGSCFSTDCRKVRSYIGCTGVWVVRPPGGQDVSRCVHVPVADRPALRTPTPGHAAAWGRPSPRRPSTPGTWARTGRSWRTCGHTAPLCPQRSASA